MKEAGGPPGALEVALAELCVGRHWDDPTVTVTGTASVGAQRATLFVDVTECGETTPAVAQVGGGILTTMPAVTEASLIMLTATEGVPVAQVYAASNSAPGIDRPVMVLSRAPGLSIPRQVLRSTAELKSGEALARDCGTALANLHRIPAGAAPPELDRLSTRDTFGDYYDRLTSSLDQLPDPHPAIRLGVEWLRRHRPSMPPRQAIVHADFRNGNLLVDQGRLSAVLDWELAHVGDPMEDLAYLCLRTWRFGNDHLTVGGFGSLEALRGAYEAGGGDWRHDAFRWWLAARTAWWACGLAAQAAAFSAGMSDSIVLAAGGRRVVELEYDLLNLIDPAVPEECF